MNILENNNITKIVISLIVIFAIIFIIVGERPRHEANVKNQEPQEVKKGEAKDSPIPKPTQEKSKEKVRPSKAEEVEATVKTPENKHDMLVSKIDGKKLIESKYNNKDNALMEQAIQAHNKTQKTEPVITSTKDNTDVAETKKGTANTTSQLEVPEADLKKIQEEEEDKGVAKTGSLTDLSEPTQELSTDVNPAIQEERNLEEEFPQRYATSTVIGTNIVYAIDTTTAQVKVLLNGDSFWTSLGKPEGVGVKSTQGYILEGATKDSAVILDSSTAKAWRVTHSDDDIEWTEIKPFSDND